MGVPACEVTHTVRTSAAVPCPFQAESTERKLTQEFEDCTSQLKDEFARFETDKKADFQTAATQLVATMLASQKKIIDLWSALLPELQNLPQDNHA